MRARLTGITLRRSCWIWRERCSERAECSRSLTVTLLCVHAQEITHISHLDIHSAKLCKCPQFHRGCVLLFLSTEERSSRRREKTLAVMRLGNETHEASGQPEYFGWRQGSSHNQCDYGRGREAWARACGSQMLPAQHCCGLFAEADLRKSDGKGARSRKGIRPFALWPIEGFAKSLLLEPRL
jgi:hypothetical protein